MMGCTISAPQSVYTLSHGSPLSRELLFPARECAPVLAAVKQSALDGGCGPALAGGGGNGAGNGSAGLLVRA